MRSTTLTALAALAAGAHAFRDSSPLLIWGSASDALRLAQNALQPGAAQAEDVYAQLRQLGCAWESVTVVHMDELHASHIPSLPLPPAARSMDGASNVRIPYLLNPSRAALDSALQDWAQLCGASVVSGEAAAEQAPQGERVIVNVNAADKNDLLSLPSSSLTILTSAPLRPATPHRVHAKRQSDDPDLPDRPAPSHTSSPSSSSKPSPSHSDTLPPADAPLLDRVQLFTTPLITAILISFGVLIPVLLFGIKSLADIQVPPRMLEISKGTQVGKEKKNQ